MLNKIVNAYLVKYNTSLDKRKSLEDKKTRLECRLEKINKQLEKAWEKSPRWEKEIVEPIAQVMAEQLPNYDYRVSGPFGICASMSIFFTRKRISDKEKYEDGNSLFFSIEPGDLKEGQLFVRDYTINTHKFKMGTIGDMNGMNHPAVPIPSDADIKWFMDWLKKQNEVKES